jgi:hypothetical protein
MDDITSRLRSGLHRPEAIILAGVTHDQRCLIAADEIERLRAALDSMRGRYRLYAGWPDHPWGVGETDAEILKMADDVLGNTTAQEEAKP